jgi:hypothetical protein
LFSSQFDLSLSLTATEGAQDSRVFGQSEPFKHDGRSVLFDFTNGFHGSRYKQLTNTLRRSNSFGGSVFGLSSHIRRSALFAWSAKVYDTKCLNGSDFSTVSVSLGYSSEWKISSRFAASAKLIETSLGDSRGYEATAGFNRSFEALRSANFVASSRIGVSESVGGTEREDDSAGLPASVKLTASDGGADSHALTDSAALHRLEGLRASGELAVSEGQTESAGLVMIVSVKRSVAPLISVVVSALISDYWLEFVRSAKINICCDRSGEPVDRLG